MRETYALKRWRYEKESNRVLYNPMEFVSAS
jgi:hypothetical protein